MPKPVVFDPPSVPFSLANVEPLGITFEVLRAAHQTGRIVRLAQGVYVASSAVPADPAAAHVQRAVATQLLRQGSVASHYTAALAWGLTLPDDTVADGPLEFTCSPKRARRAISRPDLTVALRPLPAHHRAQHPSGLIATTQARTAVDVAARLSLPDALVVLDGVARTALLEAVGASGMRRAYRKPKLLADACLPLAEAAGIAATRLTRVRLAEYVALADPRWESGLESLSYGHMVRARLPLPQLQLCISTPQGDFYPDFCWPDRMLIGEADGKSKYREMDDLHRQVDRQAVLEAMGYRFVRWSYDQMRNRPGVPIGNLARWLI